MERVKRDDLMEHKSTASFFSFQEVGSIIGKVMLFKYDRKFDIH